MNRRLGVSLTLLALVWLFLSHTSIPDVVTEGAPGPRAFPILLGIVLGVLGVALAFARPAAPAADDDLSPAEAGRRTRMAFGVFSLLVVYAYVLERAGFILSTMALIVIAMTVLLKIRRLSFVGALAVLFALACWAVFVPLLGVPLPGGSWMP